MSRRVQYLGLFFFLMLCLGAGGLGAWATTPEINTWYRTLTKPAWNPPDKIFGPVWTMLYILMGVAGWMVWKLAGFRKSAVPLVLFAAQLLLNIAWSWIFFGMHQPGWAFAEIVVLWLTIGATMVLFFRKSQVAGWLFVPYWAWVSFASVLNFAIWQLNKL